MSLSVRLHDCWETLAKWADQWNRWANDNPFRTWTWLTTWWSVYRPVYRRSRLHVLSIQSGEEPVGFAPLFSTWHPLWGWTIRLLGSGEVCSDDLGWIAQERFQQEVGKAIARFLHSHTVKSASLGALQNNVERHTIARVACHRLDFEGVKGSDSGLQAFLGELHRLGWTVDVRCDEHCWQIALPGTWEEYLQNVLGRAMRKKVRRLSERYLASGEIKVHATERDESWETAWDHLIDLHQARRRQLGKGGAFDSSAFRCFHRTVLRHLIPDNKARLVWLEWQGQPIAAEYLLLSEGVVRAYQSGMNPQFAHISPGVLANLVAIRQAISEKCSLFDFLRGDEPYKREWGAQPVKMVRIRAAPPRPAAQIRFALWRTARACRNRLLKKDASEGFSPARPENGGTDSICQNIPMTTDKVTCLVSD